MSKSLLGLFVAVLFVLGFSAGIANAASLSAPSVTCTANNGNIDVSWTVPAGDPAAEKYAIDIVCNDNGTITAEEDFGTSECADLDFLPGFDDEDCDINYTSITGIPNSFLSGAVPGDTCQVCVRGLHKRGSNSPKIHAQGCDTCTLLAP